MTYSDEEMAEIEKDPIRLKGYFWRVAMMAKLRSLKKPEVINDHSIRMRSLDERLSKAVLENLDGLVKSIIKTP